MINLKEHEEHKMTVFKSFIKSLIKNIDNGMTLADLRAFLMELLE